MPHPSLRSRPSRCSVRAPDRIGPHPEAIQAARLWLANASDVATLQTPPREAGRLLKRTAVRVVWQLARPVRERKRARLAAQAAILGEELRFLAAGSEPKRWSVLSGRDGIFLLEHTLERVSSDSPVAPFAGWALKQLPGIRARATLALHDGIDCPEHDELQARLREHAVKLPRGSWLRQSLVEHLPAEARPEIATVDDLDNATLDLSRRGPVTRSLTLHKPGEHDAFDLTPRAPEYWRDLHGISVDEKLRGLGLGTAALTEICRYADRNGYPIAATIQNHKPVHDPTFIALVRFYDCLGFSPVEPRADGCSYPSSSSARWWEAPW